MKTPIKRISGTILAVALLTCGTVQAADYPDRPVTLVVPFAPGGSSDIVARLYAQQLEAKLGQQVLVENVGGAGGTIGAQRVARGEADGYTLLVGSGSELYIYRHLNAAPGYDASTDFVPIGMLGVGPMVVVGSPNLPVDSFADVAKLAAEGGGTSLSYGSAGIGTFMHLAGEAVRAYGKLDVVHVPYRGAGPLMVDVVGSQVDLGVSSLAGALPFLAQGQGKALVVTSAERTALAPDIPTLSEQPGFEGFELELWIGLFAPTSTPADIVEVVSQATREIEADESFRKRLSDQALVARPDLTGDALQTYLAQQDEKYRAIVSGASVRAD